jgi:hypothetical protein
LKQRQLIEQKSGSIRGTLLEIEMLADQVQADDRKRLLEPTRLPKNLRGFKRRAPPNTALLSRIAFEAFKSRMRADGHNLTDEQAARMFRGTG